MVPSAPAASRLDPWCASNRNKRVSDPEPRPLEVLLLAGDSVPLAPLATSLEAAGIRVDTVDSLQAATRQFFGAGGHDCLVVGPDVRPGVARAVLAALRSVDPELALATFGREIQRGQAPSRTAALGSLHPGTRAGAGALVRFLRSVRRR
jgi:hypothetical protein